MYNRVLNAALLSVLLISSAAVNAQSFYINHAMPEDTPTSNFIFHPDGTVTDKTTGLMWKRCSEGETFADNGTPANYLDDRCTGGMVRLNWKDALKHAATANAGNTNGYNDWRLPNLRELKSMVEYRRQSPAANTEVFVAQADEPMWTSTPTNYPDHASESTAIYFYNGDDIWVGRSAELPLRLVRSAN